MKNIKITTSIISSFAILLLSNFVYGSDWPYLHKHNECDLQIIPCYTENSYHTPEAWKNIKDLDDPTITKSEEAIAQQRAHNRLFRHHLNGLTPLSNFITITDSYCSTNSSTPEITNEKIANKNKYISTSAKKYMHKAQACLENIEDNIQKNITKIEHSIQYHKKSNCRDDNYEYYGEMNIIETQRRFEIFSQYLCKKEMNTNKRKFESD